jgi:hypothetical protein
MSSFGARIFTGGILAFIGLITVKAVLAVLAGFLALVSFLVFTVLPIAIIGWLLMKAFRHFKAEDRPAFD